MKKKQLFAWIIFSTIIFNIYGCTKNNSGEIKKEYKESAVKTGDAIKLNEFTITSNGNEYYKPIGYYNGDIYAIKYKEKSDYIPGTNAYSKDTDKYAHLLTLNDDSNYIYLLKKDGKIEKSSRKIPKEYAEINNLKINEKLFSEESASYYNISNGEIKKFDFQFSNNSCINSVLGNDHYIFINDYTNNYQLLTLMNYDNNTYYSKKVKYNEFYTCIYDEKSKNFYMMIEDSIKKVIFKEDQSFDLVDYDTLLNFKNSFYAYKYIKPIMYSNGYILIKCTSYNSFTNTIDSYYYNYNITGKILTSGFEPNLNDKFKEDKIISKDGNYFITIDLTNDCDLGKLKYFDEEGSRIIYDLNDSQVSKDTVAKKETDLFITPDNKAVITIRSKISSDKNKIDLIILDLSN